MNNDCQFKPSSFISKRIPTFLVCPYICLCILLISLSNIAQANQLSPLPATTRSITLIEPLRLTNSAINYKATNQSHKTTNYENTNNEIKANTQLFPPASTLKTVTALTAQLSLGNDFHFQTSIYRSQHDPLHQDLIINFNGDPTLTTADLKTLLKQVKQQGIKQITGDIWLNNQVFNGYEQSVGTPWDINGVCYSAPSSAITLDHNCVRAALYTLKHNPHKTRLHVPSYQPITVINNTFAVTRTQQKQQHCQLGLIAAPNNHYQLQGCLIHRAKPLPLNFAIQDTGLYTQHKLQWLLKKLGIKLLGEIKIGRPNYLSSDLTQNSGTKNSSLQLIATHKSAPLPVLLKIMLHKSDNLIANNLTKIMGHRLFSQPGNFQNGIAAIKKILKQQAQIDLSQAQLVDGSGLSRSNRIRATDLAHVLRYIWQHDTQLQLIEKMPVAGVSGTLKYKPSMQSANIKNKIIAKSGSLYATHNMVGYGLDKNGKPATLFVQFVTDYFPTKTKKYQPSPLTQFETSFYQAVVEKSQSLETFD